LYPVIGFNQSVDSLNTRYLILLKSSLDLSNNIQDQVWPSWSEAPNSILLVTSGKEYLTHHPSPSKDFMKIGFNSYVNDTIYVRSRQFSPHLKATFPAVSNIPTIVIGPPDSTQSVTEWILIVLHEHFHQWQMSRPSYYESVNSLGLADDDTGQWMLNYPFPYESSDINEIFNELKTQLKIAIESVNKPTFEENFDNFIQTRKRFKEALNSKDYRYFSFQIWQEGVARYVEFKSAQFASKYYSPSMDLTSLPGYDSFESVSRKILKGILDGLMEMKLSKDKRVAFYSFGAAEAILLDYVNPDWNKLYFKKKFFLEDYYK